MLHTDFVATFGYASPPILNAAREVSGTAVVKLTGMQCTYRSVRFVSLPISCGIVTDAISLARESVVYIFSGRPRVAPGGNYVVPSCVIDERASLPVYRTDPDVPHST